MCRDRYPSPVERAADAAVPCLLVGAAFGVSLPFVPGDIERIPLSLIHLGAFVGLGLLLSVRLGPTFTRSGTQQLTGLRRIGASSAASRWW